MPIVSISLTFILLERLDRFMKEMGYLSRSEAIRDAIRNLLSDYELTRIETGKVTATITVVSRHERHGVDEQLMCLRHEYDEIMSGNMHIHLGKSYCLEIFITEDDIKEVINFMGKIRVLRGVSQVKYTMFPLAVDEETRDDHLV
ncbi:MAG: CopG family ribbon-helix-helix protein [archaeon GB-1867-035]|mgnify:CR=1 FL=1|nr:CopG family ribbon-helix-helix protein [Candidatus Culexmicrobium profundum]